MLEVGRIEVVRLGKRHPKGHGLYGNQQTASADGLTPTMTITGSLAENRGYLGLGCGRPCSSEASPRRLSDTRYAMRYSLSST